MVSSWDVINSLSSKWTNHVIRSIHTIICVQCRTELESVSRIRLYRSKWCSALFKYLYLIVFEKFTESKIAFWAVSRFIGRFHQELLRFCQQQYAYSEKLKTTWLSSGSSFQLDTIEMKQFNCLLGRIWFYLQQFQNNPKSKSSDWTIALL